MVFKKLVIPNTEGANLSARLDLPLDKQPVAYALFAHCFTCSKSLSAANNISRALNREGVAVLRFDFTGLGESEGDFAETNFSTNVSDLLAAAQYLEKEHARPSILVGHSLGGAAILLAALRLSSVKAVATIGAPSEPSHVMRLFAATQDAIESHGESQVSIAGRTFKIKKQFLDDLRQTNLLEGIGSLKCAFLILHSPVDNTVGIENAARLYEAARHPKSFVSLDRADHLLTDRNTALYTGKLIAAWAGKYIATDLKYAEKNAPADNRIVVHTGRQGFRTDINANGHSLVADEPVSVGGTNAGPTPYDYLVTGLGACTSMTLRMYADHKQWPLEEVKVTLRHQKIYAEDCEECEAKDTKIDQIEREIQLIGDLDEGQRQRLLEIADKCPVHKTLHSELRVRTVEKRA
jgi:putative redox protein